MANEGPSGPRFVGAVLERCQHFGSVDFFAVVDHASKDDTLAQLREFAAREPRLRIVWAPENRCVVDAYMQGYRTALASCCQWILEIDAGFSHRPEDIPQFFEAMTTGYDCVFGSRFMPGGAIRDSSLRRKLVSWGGTAISNTLLGTSLTDMTSGFELFTAEALAMVLNRGIQSRGPFFQTEIKFHCRRLRVKEVPIVYRAASGTVGRRELAESFKLLWSLRQNSKRERKAGSLACKITPSL